MRRFVFASTALAALALATTPAWTQTAPAQNQPVQAQEPDPVLAVVNGSKIRKSDVEAAYASLPAQYRQMPVEVIFEPLLERVIDSRLLLVEAEKQNLAGDPEVQAQIERARNDVLRDSFVEQAIEKGSTDERLQAAYNAMKSQPGFAYEEVHARHVLLESEEEAKQVIEQLKGGADFAELAKTKSKDPSAQSNAGDLGYFRREAMVPEFADAAFSIEPGMVGSEPIKSQFGWHVIKVEDRRQAVPSFEEKEPELREQVAREIVTALLSNVREGAKIERFNPDGSPKSLDEEPKAQ